MVERAVRKRVLLSNGRSERLSRFVGGKKVGVVAMKSALAFWASVACDRPAAWKSPSRLQSTPNFRQLKETTDFTLSSQISDDDPTLD